MFVKWPNLLFNADGEGAGGVGGGGVAEGGSGGGDAGGGSADAGGRQPQGLRQAAAAAAAGAGGGGNPDGGDGASPGDGAGATGGDSLAWPTEFPEQFKADSYQEALDKLHGAYKGARAELGKRGSVPDSGDGYEFAMSEKMQGHFGDAGLAGDDPVVAMYRNAAHKHGLTKEQAAGVFQEIMDASIDQGIFGQAVDPVTEAKALLGDQPGVLPDKLVQMAVDRMEAVDGWLQAMRQRQEISEAGYKALEPLLETAAGIQTLEAMRSQMRETGIQTGGRSASTELTRADLDKRVADPRNDPTGGRFDRAFREETDRLFKEMYADNAA